MDDLIENKKKPIKQFIIIAIESIACITTILLSIFLKPINGYKMMWLIPAFYLLCVILFKEYTKKFLVDIAVTAIHIISFIKYVVMIGIIAIIRDYNNGVLTGQTPDNQYVKKAIILLLIEIITVFLGIEVFQKVHKKNRIVNINANVNIKKIIKYIFICVSLALAIIYWKSFIPINFILYGKFETVPIVSPVSGAIKIDFYMFKAFLLCEALKYCFKKYELSNNIVYAILSILAIGIYSFLMISMSRWNIIFPLIFYFIVSKQVFKKKIIILDFIVAIVLGIALVKITYAKFSFLFADGEKKNFLKIIEVLSSQVQEYFSGIRPVAQGIQTAHEFKKQITFTTFFNDFAGSIPYASHFIDQTNRINYYFNVLVKGPNQDATQIMPMITIGYSYFGIVFSGIFTFISIFISCKLSSKANDTNNILQRFALIIGTFWFSMCLGFNTQIIWGNFISSIVPILLLSLLIEERNFKNE